MRPPRCLGQEHGLYEEKPGATLAQPRVGDTSEKPPPLCSPFGPGCGAQPRVHRRGRSARPGHAANAASSDATGGNARPWPPQTPPSNATD